jgi:hypothetical protein
VLTGTYALHLLLTGMNILLAGMHMFMYIFLAHTGMYVFLAHTGIYMFLAHTGGYLFFEICLTISAGIDGF